MDTTISKGHSDEDEREWQRETSQLKAGGTDHEGEVITLVYRVSATFAIYITENGVKHLSKEPLGNRFAQIANPANELNHYRHQFPFIDMAVAQAKAACFEGGEEQAREVLSHTHTRVLQLLTAAGRLRYVIVCMVTSGAVLATVAVTSHFALPQEHLFVAWMAACGSIGAFLSVSLNLSRLQIDPAAPRMLTTISAVSRIVIGMIGAVFLLLVVRGHLLLGILADLNNPQAFLAVGVLAGFSETFIPNVMRRVETEADPTIDSTPSSKARESAAPRDQSGAAADR